MGIECFPSLCLMDLNQGRQLFVSIPAYVKQVGSIKGNQRALSARGWQVCLLLLGSLFTLVLQKTCPRALYNPYQDSQKLLEELF